MDQRRLASGDVSTVRGWAKTAAAVRESCSGAIGGEEAVGEEEEYGVGGCSGVWAG